MESLLALVEKRPGVLQREFLQYQTIVAEGARNPPFYKLLSGTLQFEKSLDRGRSVVLRQIESNPEWPLFCELTALSGGVVSASVVVRSKRALVMVIPSFIVFEVLEANPSVEAKFLKAMAIRLAHIQPTHDKALLPTFEGVASRILELNNEPSLIAWEGSVKRGFGFSPNSRGHLILSQKYISFRCLKSHSETSKETMQEILPLLEVTKISLQKEKVRISVRNEKLVVVLDRLVSAENVKSVLLPVWTAARSHKKDQKKGFLRRRTENQQCPHCAEKLCVHCRNFRSFKCQCLHSFSSPKLSNFSSRCQSCGQDQAHLFSFEDLKQFKKAHPPKSYSSGELIVDLNQEVSCLYYVLEGETYSPLWKKTMRAGHQFNVLGSLLNVPCTERVEGGTPGCSILAIPWEKLFEQRELNLQSQFYFSLLLFLKERLFGWEKGQLQQYFGSNTTEKSLSLQDLLKKTHQTLLKRDFELGKWVFSFHADSICQDWWRSLLFILSCCSPTTIEEFFSSLMRSNFIQNPDTPLRQSCASTSLIIVVLYSFPCHFLKKILVDLSKKVSIRARNITDVALEISQDQEKLTEVKKALRLICETLTTSLPKPLMKVLRICVMEYGKLREEYRQGDSLMINAFMSKEEMKSWILCVMMLYMVSPSLIKAPQFLGFSKKSFSRLRGLPRFLAIVLQKAASENEFGESSSLKCMNPVLRILKKILTPFAQEIVEEKSSDLSDSPSLFSNWSDQLLGEPVHLELSRSFELGGSGKLLNSSCEAVSPKKKSVGRRSGDSFGSKMKKRGQGEVEEALEKVMYLMDVVIKAYKERVEEKKKVSSTFSQDLVECKRCSVLAKKQFTCKLCEEIFCEQCSKLGALKNSCSNGQRHDFPNVLAESPTLKDHKIERKEVDEIDDLEEFEQEFEIIEIERQPAVKEEEEIFVCCSFCFSTKVARSCPVCFENACKACIITGRTKCTHDLSKVEPEKKKGGTEEVPSCDLCETQTKNLRICHICSETVCKACFALGRSSCTHDLSRKKSIFVPSPDPEESTLGSSRTFSSCSFVDIDEVKQYSCDICFSANAIKSCIICEENACKACLSLGRVSCSHDTWRDLSENSPTRQEQQDLPQGKKEVLNCDEAYFLSFRSFFVAVDGEVMLQRVMDLQSDLRKYFEGQSSPELELFKDEQHSSKKKGQTTISDR